VLPIHRHRDQDCIDDRATLLVGHGRRDLGGLCMRRTGSEDQS
jgi:hypothetical protein